MPAPRASFLGLDKALPGKVPMAASQLAASQLATRTACCCCPVGHPNCLAPRAALAQSPTRLACEATPGIASADVCEGHVTDERETCPGRLHGAFDKHGLIITHWSMLRGAAKARYVKMRRFCSMLSFVL